MSQRTFLGHPIGLFVLFFTEMWERFSYYGMRALLVLYMVDYFKWTQTEASGIYKWYTALVYLTPLLGGFVADKYIGNKWAIIIGATSMAIGHFCMAFEQLSIFYAALIFLIIGNGFFKPNMSTQVGRLYPQNDPRRDGAYTIFYMGINLGAFLAPLVCGALRDTPGLGFHWGFGAAGVGMVIGLLTYLFGLPFVKELPPGLVYQSPGANQNLFCPSCGARVDSLDSAGAVKCTSCGHLTKLPPRKQASGGAAAITEDEAARTPSAMPGLASMASTLVLLMGVGLLIAAPLLWWAGWMKFDNCVMLVLAAIAAFFASWIVSKVKMAVRDRVLAIYALFVFVVFFWAAFEQAGNAMNVWADQTTNRYITDTPPEPVIFPEAPVDVAKEGLWPTLRKAFGKLGEFNPVLTTSFQSINALAIVVLAPIFAWLWTALARRQVHLSIAMKMAIGVFLQGAAFALMIWSVKYENQPSSSKLANLPANVVMDAGKVHFYDAPDLGDKDAFDGFMAGKMEKTKTQPMIAHGGRLAFDAGGAALNLRGVLDANHRDRILRSTAPKGYVKEVWDLAEQSKKAKADAKAKGQDKFTIEKVLSEVPPGFEPRYLSGFKPDQVRFDAASKKLIVGMELADKDYKQIVLAGADPTFRAALNDLYIKGSKFRVSSWWLFWFYILCTLGELCLSPVGLSMVSKLAPRQYATMLMGIWLLASTFGNFIAGFLGENWEYHEPGAYFLRIVIGMLGASVVCFFIAKKITRMMHGVT